MSSTHKISNILICVTFLIVLVNATANDCKEPNVHSGSNLVGGVKPAAVNQTDVIDAALKSSLLWNKKSNFQNFYKVTVIRKAYSQVVSGVIYSLNVTIHETNCAKENILSRQNVSTTDLNSCSTATGAQFNCFFKLWLQPWLNPNGDLTCWRCI